MHFEIDKNAQGQFIWRLRANNGQIVAVSGESYVNKADCVNGLNLVKSALSQTPVQDKTMQMGGILGRM